MSENKPFLVLSTLGGSISYATGMLRHGELYVLEFKTISGRFKSWVAAAKEVLENAKAKGLDILIEDANGLFGNYGLSIKLGALCSTGRTYQNEALDFYFGMARLGGHSSLKVGNRTEHAFGAVIYVNNSVSSAIRPDATVNIDYDERGRARYDMEEELSPNQRCILLLSLCAAGVGLQDASKADDMMAMVEKNLQEAADDAYSATGLPLTLKSLLSDSVSVADPSKLKGYTDGH